MPIRKYVNKTKVIASEKFTYTFDIQFTEINGSSNNAKVSDYFPDKIILDLPQIGGRILSINEIPQSGGRILEFNFGQVLENEIIIFTLDAFLDLEEQIMIYL